MSVLMVAVPTLIFIRQYPFPYEEFRRNITLHGVELFFLVLIGHFLSLNQPHVPSLLGSNDTPRVMRCHRDGMIRRHRNYRVRSHSTFARIVPEEQR